MSTTFARWAVAVVIGLVLLVAAVAVGTRSDDVRTSTPRSTSETEGRGGRISFT